LIAIILQAQLIIGIESDICRSAFLLDNGLISVQLTPPKIEVKVPEFIKSGENVAIKIKGLKNVTGLTVQAKTLDDSSIGKFSSDIKANQTNCLGISKSLAIYRISPFDVETEIQWKAPSIKEAKNFRFQ
jgi:hypothetical protein